MTEEASGIVVALGEDGVQRITIDRADVGNSLSPLARDALTEAFRTPTVTPRSVRCC